MNILIIEDEARIASFVRRGLESEGYRVEVGVNGQEGLELACSTEFDLVILDLLLPRLPGEAVLRGMREAGVSTPVIILTAKDAIPDRVRNLNAGADDYVTKPFSFDELLARIRARLRPPSEARSTELVVGPIRLDISRREVLVGQERCVLTSREFALLETFMRHPGQVLSQSVLLDRVWGFDFDPGSNVVEVYVGYLRRKLGPGLIETVRGAGYRLRG